MPNTICSRNSLRRVITGQEDLRSKIMHRYHEIFPHHAPAEEFAGDILDNLQHEHTDDEIYTRLQHELHMPKTEAERLVAAISEDAYALHAHWTQWLPEERGDAARAASGSVFSIIEPALVPRDTRADRRRHFALPQPQLQSALFRLPPELRAAIFELAVYAPYHPQRVPPEGGLATSYPFPRRRQPALLVPDYARPPPLTATCRQARAEALGLFYANNVFVARSLRDIDPERCTAWVERLPVHLMERLPRLVFLSHHFP